MKKQLLLLSIAAFFVSAYAIVRIGTAQATPHTDVSYTNDIRPILAGRCSNCHAGKLVSNGLNMETYESLMAGSQHGPVIVPGNASSSLLAEKLTSGQMPKRGPKLTPTQIQLIIDWINAGALNN